MKRLVKIRKFNVPLIFALIYSVVFFQYRHGLGNNWDWIVPYFSHQYQPFYSQQLTAWRQQALGTPLSYAPSLLFYLIQIPLLKAGLPTEWMILAIIIILATVCSSVMYYYWRDRLPNYLAFLLGLAIWLNPAIFYKLLAGHLNYLLGYTFFICLFVYLWRRQKLGVQEGVISGLLIALSTTQIQFAAFCAVLLIVRAVWLRSATTWRFWATAGLIFVLYHSYWLLPFFGGGSSLATVSGVAQVNTFEALTHTKAREILTLTFSSATFIRAFYPKLTWAYFSALYVVVGVFAYISRARLKQLVDLFVVLLIFGFLLTGIYQYHPLPGLGLLYPMFREAGHAAPVWVFLLLVLLAALLPVKSKICRVVAASYLIGFLVINGVIFASSLPKVNYAQARAQFAEFDAFNQQDSSTYRILTYPFFNQYSLSQEETRYYQNAPVSNSGWDSFTIFSGKDYIENAVSPSDFKNSLQYQFLQTYNVDVLRNYNVKYIYDYSQIYQSNYDRFVEPSVYNNDVQLIKNDPNFFQKVIEKNPGKVKQVSPHVLEITNFEPRIITANGTFTKINETAYAITINNLTSTQSLTFLANFHPGWELYVAPYQPDSCSTHDPITNECLTGQSLFGGALSSIVHWPKPFGASHTQVISYANSWQVDPAAIKKLPTQDYKTNPDGSIDVRLVLFYRPETELVIGSVVSALTLLLTVYFYVVRRRNITREH